MKNKITLPIELIKIAKQLMGNNPAKLERYLKEAPKYFEER